MPENTDPNRRLRAKLQRRTAHWELNKAMEAQVLTILRGASDLIADRVRWCRGALARDRRGAVVSPYTDTAVRWCAVGAISHVWLKSLHENGGRYYSDPASLAGDDQRPLKCAHDLLDVVSEEIGSRCGNVIGLNDYPAPNHGAEDEAHKNVVAAFKLATEYAEGRL